MHWLVDAWNLAEAKAEQTNTPTITSQNILTIINNSYNNFNLWLYKFLEQNSFKLWL